MRSAADHWVWMTLDFECLSEIARDKPGWLIVDISAQTYFGDLWNILLYMYYIHVYTCAYTPMYYIVLQYVTVTMSYHMKLQYHMVCFRFLQAAMARRIFNLSSSNVKQKPSSI